jgi:TonB family protein
MTVFVLVLALGAPIQSGWGQTTRPVNKTGLIKVLRDRSLPNDELAQIIRERGVDFAISAEDEREMVGLGGDAALVDAVRNGMKAPPKAAPPPPAAELKLPGGPPLGRSQVLLLLEAQVDQDAVRKLIELRGTTMAMNSGAASDLAAAGASSALIGTLLIHQKEAPRTVAVAANAGLPAAPPVPPPTAAPALTPAGQKQPPPQQQQAQPQPLPPPAGPIRVDSFTQAQKLRTTTKPVYPLSAQQQRVQGRVVLSVLVAPHGGVKSVRPLRGPIQLVSAAEEAVKKWTWEPTLINGFPVEVMTDVTIEFKIVAPGGGSDRGR